MQKKQPTENQKNTKTEISVVPVFTFSLPEGTISPSASRQLRNCLHETLTFWPRSDPELYCASLPAYQGFAKDQGPSARASKHLVRGPHKLLLNNFERRTSYAMWLFRNILHYSKSTKFS